MYIHSHELINSTIYKNGIKLLMEFWDLYFSPSNIMFPKFFVSCSYSSFIFIAL